MREWKKVRIGEFLTESKEEAINSDSSRRITVRLNCRGVEHRKLKAEKDGATKYYIRHAGQFIYGKQNIHKGAFGIIPKELEGFTSSADLPAFDFINDLCFPEFLNLWLQVDERYKALQKNVKGAGSQRLAVSAFLDEGISLPDLPTQKQIVKRISENLKWVNELAKEIETQKGYTKLLRRNILQDAIEGKLTADWRKEHPVQKGNPDYDAEALFELIQKERKVDKKRKALPPILDAEKPFELPTGWKWVRLKQISEIGTGATPLTSEKRYYENGTIPWITSSSTGNDFIIEADDFITTEALDETNCNVNPVGTLIVAMYGQGKTRGQIAELCIEAATNQACATIQVPDTQDNILRSFIKLVFKKMYHEIRQLAQGGTQPNLNLSKIANTVFCIPPLAEQQEIVETVSDTLDTILKIEKQIQERRILSERLISGIIRGNLEEKENC